MMGCMNVVGGKFSKRAAGRFKARAGQRWALVGVERLDERVVLSTAPISAVTGLASTAVVDLKITFPNQKSMLGTGAMIDSFHVLTSAHLLYSAQDGGYATSILAAPGANGSETPHGTANATYVRVDPTWISFNRTNPGKTSPSVSDVGLVTLDRTIGRDTGSFQIGFKTDDKFFKNATFQTAGYPTLHGLHIAEAVAIAGKSSGVVSTNGVSFKQGSLPVTPGQSGSPLWRQDSKGKGVVYGVVSGADGYGEKNKVYASRITKEVYNQLKSWMKKDKTPGSAPKGPVSLKNPGVKESSIKPMKAPKIVVEAMGDYQIVFDDNAPKGSNYGNYDYSTHDSGYGDSGQGDSYDSSSSWFPYWGSSDSAGQWYGNYLGPGNAGWDTYPTNSLDWAAWQHDYEYDLNGTSGVWGALFDSSVSGADWSLATNAWDSFWNDSSLGYWDKLWAAGTGTVFGGLGYGKELYNTASSWGDWLGNSASTWVDSLYGSYNSLFDTLSYYTSDDYLYDWMSSSGGGYSYDDGWSSQWLGY